MGTVKESTMDFNVVKTEKNLPVRVHDKGMLVLDDGKEIRRENNSEAMSRM